MKDKEWNLDNARADYKNNHPKQFKKKRDCDNCRFSTLDGNFDCYCQVKEKTLFFFGHGIIAKLCKYFT